MFIIRQQLLTIYDSKPVLSNGPFYGGCDQYNRPLYGGVAYIFYTEEAAFIERDRLLSKYHEQGKVFAITLTEVPEPIKFDLVIVSNLKTEYRERYKKDLRLGDAEIWKIFRQWQLVASEDKDDKEEPIFYALHEANYSSHKTGQAAELVK